MAQSTHAERFTEAQAEYQQTVGHPPPRVWMTALFVVTATTGLWQAHQPHLIYGAHIPTIEVVARLSLDEQLVAAVARNLAAGDVATASDHLVDLAACCIQMDDQTFEVIVAACRMLRGDSAAARRLLEP